MRNFSYLIKLNGYRALVKELGTVQAEKFITLIQQEPFDYTEWQKDLWLDKSIEEISSKAAESSEIKKENRA